MNEALAQTQTSMFYTLLGDAAHNAHIGGTLGPALLKFFELPEIRTRFTTAPASTALRFHHAYAGGLVVHTVEMFRVAQLTANVLGNMSATPGMFLGWTFTGSEDGFVRYIDLLAAVAIHDLNKIGDTFGNANYVPNMIKKGTVRSDAIPYETNSGVCKFSTLASPSSAPPVNQALYLAEEAKEWVPDGSQSLTIVRALDPGLYALLSEGVKWAIIHHDGAYGKGRRRLTGNETPLQMILHFSDMWSSRLSKVEQGGRQGD